MQSHSAAARHAATGRLVAVTMMASAIDEQLGFRVGDGWTRWKHDVTSE